MTTDYRNRLIMLKAEIENKRQYILDNPACCNGSDLISENLEILVKYYDDPTIVSYNTKLYLYKSDGSYLTCGISFGQLFESMVFRFTYIIYTNWI